MGLAQAEGRERIATDSSMGNGTGIRKPLRSHRWKGQPVGEGKPKQRDKADRARAIELPGQVIQHWCLARWVPHEGSGGLRVSGIWGKWALNAYSYVVSTVFMK